MNNDNFSITRSDWDDDYANDYNNHVNNNPGKNLDNFQLKNLDLQKCDQIFMHAFNKLPQNVDLGNDKRRQITSAIDGHQPKPEAFITEMLQNALDVEASMIRLGINSDSLIFEHNGKSRSGNYVNYPFSPHDLVGLTSIHSTEKACDPHTIGTFGLGFKYWINFFKVCKISSHCKISNDVMRVTNMQFNNDFNPKTSMLSAESIPKSDENYTTRYTFSGMRNRPEWQNIDETIGDRFYKSLPTLSTKKQFKLTVESHGQTNSYVSKSDQSYEHNELKIDKVTIQKGENHQEEYLRFVIKMDNLLEKYLDEDNKNLFLEYACKKIASLDVEQKKMIGGEDGYKEAFKIVDVCISLPFNDYQNGYCSSLFVTPKTRVPMPGVFDAPWRLDSSRLLIDDNEGEEFYFSFEYNKMLSELVSQFYDEALIEILNDEVNYGFTSSMMFRYLNAKYTASDKKWVDGWKKDDDSWPISDFNSSDLLGENDFSLELLDLFIFIHEEPDWTSYDYDKQQVLNWLSNALDPSLTTVLLADKTRCPVLRYGGQKTSNIPEINSEIGDRIPNYFTDEIEENDSEHYPSWTTCFDYLVSDENSIKFLSNPDVKDVIITLEEVEDLTINDIMNAFGDLSQEYPIITKQWKILNSDSQLRKDSEDDDYLSDNGKMIEQTQWLEKRFIELHDLSLSENSVDLQHLKQSIDDYQSNTNKLVGDTIYPIFRDNGDLDVLILPPQNELWGIISSPARYVGLDRKKLQSDSPEIEIITDNPHFGFYQWSQEISPGIIDTSGLLSEMLGKQKQITLQSPFAWKGLPLIDSNRREHAWPNEHSNLVIHTVNLINDDCCKLVKLRTMPLFIDCIGTQNPDISILLIRNKYFELDKYRFKYEQLHEFKSPQSDVKFVNIDSKSLDCELALSSILGDVDFEKVETSYIFDNYKSTHKIPIISNNPKGISSFSVVRVSGLIAKISELVGTINQDSTSERIKFLSSATKLYSEYDFLESFNQDDKKILTAMRV